MFCGYLQVVQGMDVVKKIESQKTDSRDRPENAVVISLSGELPVSETFMVAREPATE